MTSTVGHRVVVLVLAALVVVFAGCGSTEAETPEIDRGASSVDSDLGATLEALGLKSLASAVAEVDLGELVETDEYTLFAPTDEAFATLTADELADVLSDPQLLTDVLRHHVVENRVDAATLEGLAGLSTASGQSLQVDVEEGVVRVGDATVVDADNETGRALIHVIDAVLMPS